MTVHLLCGAERTRTSDTSPIPRHDGIPTRHRSDGVLDKPNERPLGPFSGRRRC